MGNLVQDVRFALRTFRKAPVFVAVAILSLTLGIGANTAIFTLVDQVLLRLLPVKEPKQLVTLWGRGEHYGGNNGPIKLSYPMYADFRDKNQRVLTDFMTAITEAIQVYRKNKDAGYRSIIQITRQNDPVLLEKTYKANLQQYDAIQGCCRTILGRKGSKA